MSIYHSTGIAIKGDVSHSPGLATIYDDGRADGHVAIYTNDGSVSVRADTPEALRSLAKALVQAANELESVQAEGEALRCGVCGHRSGQHSPSGCTADRPAPLGGCTCIRTPSDVQAEVVVPA